MCRFIEFTDERLKLKVQIEDEFIYIMNKSVRPSISYPVSHQHRNFHNLDTISSLQRQHHHYFPYVNTVDIVDIAF